MKNTIIFCMIFILVTAQIALTQNFNFIGSGARARGMGGAFIGVADDATAVTWNPAGLARLEKPEASVVGLFESYFVDTDNSDYDTDARKSSHFTLNFVSAAFPLSLSNRNLVASLAYQQVLDLYSKYETDYRTIETTGGVYAITPAIGFQLTPTLVIGASVNIFTGTAVNTDEPEYGEETEVEYAYSGTNFNLGAILDLGKLRFGVVYKTPFDLTEKVEEQDFEKIYGMPKMLGLGLSFQATDKLLLAMDYEMRSYSESELEDEDGNTMDLEWEDINQIRVGMEYLKMSGNNILPLRLGFATTPSLYTDSNEDQIVGASITGGFGIIMGNINLDLGLEYNVYAYEAWSNYDTYDFTENYFRFIISGVFHFGN